MTNMRDPDEPRIIRRLKTSPRAIPVQQSSPSTFAPPWRPPANSVRRRNGRWQIDPTVFAEAQARLKKAGKAEDPCGRCGCRRDGHMPKPTYSYAKSGGSSGKSVEVPVLAPTSCDCKFCTCSCVEFVEPFSGQKFLRCTVECA